VGTVIRGTVTKTTNFGAFVQMDEDLEGLLHISELSEDKVEAPEEVVKIGQQVDVKVIKVDEENRKIGLSLKEVTEEESGQLSALYAEAAEGESPTAVGSVPENLPDEIPDLGEVVDQIDAAAAVEEDAAEGKASADEPAAAEPAAAESAAAEPAAVESAAVEPAAVEPAVVEASAEVAETVESAVEEPAAEEPAAEEPAAEEVAEDETTPEKDGESQES
jgi:small subunit ribosomal protein S1